jgi:hypothetical protein
MRAAGIVSTILCGLVAVFMIWLGYICTFEESQLLSRFESDPKEGWEYWQRLEFWQDFRAFTMWLVLALGAFVIPFLGVRRCSAPLSRRAWPEWTLFATACLYGIAWIIGVVLVLRRDDAHPIQLAPFILLAGALFAARVSWLRATRQSRIPIQQP